MRVSSLLVLFCSFVSATLELELREEPMERPMAGGYSPVEDLSGEMVISAAEFAVSQLSTADQSYSFAKSAGEIDFKIARAYQQVVAGMNYRLVVIIQDPSSGSCLGAFAVTVYNQFGKLSVTKWSSEISCEKAVSMMECKDRFHQGYNKDFN